MNTSLGDSLPCFVCGVPTSYLRLQEVNVRDKKEWQLVGYTAFPLCAEHNTDEAVAAAAEQFAKAINPRSSSSSSRAICQSYQPQRRNQALNKQKTEKWRCDCCNTPGCNCKAIFLIDGTAKCLTHDRIIGTPKKEEPKKEEPKK